jgi:hypothetical protein
MLASVRGMPPIPKYGLFHGKSRRAQFILRHWRALDLAGKDVLLRSLREPRAADLDLTTLSRLADYFQCGVYDIMRYIRSRR